MLARARPATGRQRKRAVPQSKIPKSKPDPPTRAAAFYARIAHLVDEWKRFDSPLEGTDAIVLMSGDRAPAAVEGGQPSDDEALLTWALTEWLSSTAVIISPENVFLLCKRQSRADFLQKRVLDAHRRLFTECGHAMPKLHYPSVVRNRPWMSSAVWRSVALRAALKPSHPPCWP